MFPERPQHLSPHLTGPLLKFQIALSLLPDLVNPILEGGGVLVIQELVDRGAVLTGYGLVGIDLPRGALLLLSIHLKLLQCESRTNKEYSRTESNHYPDVDSYPVRV
jgi:hypothetical protein